MTQWAGWTNSQVRRSALQPHTSQDAFEISPNGDSVLVCKVKSVSN